VSELVVVSYIDFQEYQQRRRRTAVEPARPEPSPPAEPQSPAVPSDTSPHQELSSQSPLTSADGDVRLTPRGVCDF
jgi:hypothetical protein